MVAGSKVGLVNPSNDDPLVAVHHDCSVRSSRW